nr:putative reverse transcriptase domain-containing protein [Tanacetum cinerariifolium]
KEWADALSRKSGMVAGIKVEEEIIRDLERLGLVEMNKVIQGCKLEIEGHIFDIDLIPFEHGSFDVIVGMDWLSRHKAKIVFYEKRGLLIVWHPLKWRSCRVNSENSRTRVSFEKVHRHGEYRTKEEHEMHLGLILELLKKEKWYAKFSKCEFWLQEVQFLRHVVNEDGIHVDPIKIEVVKNWEAPRTPSEVFSFLGLARYCHRFIKNLPS